MDLGDFVPFETLKGLTFTVVQKTYLDNDAILFYCADGTIYTMTHYQDYCESVYLEDICGDLNDLIGTPILTAEIGESGGEGEHGDYIEEWCFYHLRTIKGTVTLRWTGSSNGYYSVDACLYKSKEKQDELP